MKPLLTIVLIISASTWSYSQSVLDTVRFEDLTGGESLRWSQVASQGVTVLLFVSPDCPFDNQYINRIKALKKDFREVNFVWVNAGSETNHDGAQWFEKNQLNGLYILDNKHVLKNLFEAFKTPEVIVIKDRNYTEVFYKGAIDDNPQQEKQVEERYLREAIIASLIGEKPEVPYVRPMGCVIR